MIATITQPPMTADEFLSKHVDESGIELVNGRIVRTAMPGADHGEVCVNASVILHQFVKSRKLGRVMSNDTFIRIGSESVRGADVCFISYEVLPAEQPTPRGAFTPPLELVVEVRSPSDTIREMTLKADEYLGAGVKVVLIVDPESDSVGVFRSNELPQRFHNGDTLTLPDVLPEFAVPVAKFFT